MNDDDWSAYAFDVVATPNEKHPHSYFVWSGTNNPVINELACQSLAQEAWPFDSKDFGLLCSWKGIHFLCPVAIYEDNESRQRLEDAVFEPFQKAADQQGYVLHRLEGEELAGLMHHVLIAAAAYRRNPSLLSGGFSDDEGEEEQ